MTAPNPNAFAQAPITNPDVSTVTTVDPSKTGAVTSPEGFLPTVHADPSAGQPGFGVYAPLPANSTIVSSRLSVTEQLDQVDKLMGTLSSFPETFEFLALPPEVNAARLTFGAGNVPLLSANAAYAAMAAALHTAAGTSDGSTDTMALVWKGPSSDRAQAAFRHHAGWLRQQADVAATSAKIASSAADAYMTAVGTMPPVAECLAAKAAAAAAMTAAASSSGALTPGALAAEHYYDVVLRARAATSMTSYSAAAHAVLSDLPASTPPPQISSGSPSGTGPELLGGGTSGADLTSLSTTGGGLTSLTGGGGQTLTSTTQAATNAGTNLADQVGDAASNLGQTAGQQLPGIGQGDSALQDALNPPGADQLPDYAGYNQQHDPYGLTPYSSTLSGLYGGSGSMVAMSMVRGGFGTMSGAATGFRMPPNWVPRIARAFGPLGEEAPAPMAGSAAPRGASAPAEQMRRDKDKKRKKSGKVIAPGEDQNVPVLEDAPAIGVLEFVDDGILDEVADDLSLSFGVLESVSEDAPAQHVTGESHRD